MEIEWSSGSLYEIKWDGWMYFKQDDIYAKQILKYVMHINTGDVICVI